MTAPSVMVRSSSPPTNSTVVVRKNQTSACNRCKRRKIRCDAILPTCSACIKAKIECQRGDCDRSAAAATAVSSSLPQQESNQRAADNNHSNSLPYTPPSISATSQGESFPTSPFQSASPQTTVIPAKKRKAILSQQSPDHSTPRPSPSGRRSWIEATMQDYDTGWDSREKGRGDKVILPDDYNQDSKSIAKLRSDVLSHDSELPSHLKTNLSHYNTEIVERLVQRYLQYLGGVMPVFHEPDLQVYIRSACRQEPSNDVAPDDDDDEAAAATVAIHYHHAYMIIALALASLCRIEQRSSEFTTRSKAFYYKAQQVLPASSSLHSTDITKLQSTLLELQLHLMLPETGNSWEVSGTAMRLATALRLNCNDDKYSTSSSSDRDAIQVDLRRKLFWTCFVIDVSLSVAMVRPTAIDSAWISAKHPSLLHDSHLINNNKSNTSASIDQVDSQQICPVKFASRQHILLRKVESEIYRYLYACEDEGEDDPAAKEAVYTWIESKVKELYKIKANIQGESTLSFVTTEWVDLICQSIITLAYRPSPRIPMPDAFAILKALDSSSKTIEIAKNHYRTGKIKLPWIATHHVFMDGLTYLHSLKRAYELQLPIELSVVDITMHVQSCASLLQALNFAEEETVTTLHDAFEAAARAVLKKIFAVNNFSSSNAELSPFPSSSSPASSSSLEARGHFGAAAVGARLTQSNHHQYGKGMQQSGQPDRTGNFVPTYGPTRGLSSSKSSPMSIQNATEKAMPPPQLHMQRAGAQTEAQATLDFDSISAFHQWFFNPLDSQLEALLCSAAPMA